MSTVVKKKRIFQIAKELNISHIEIMKFLDIHGVSAESHMSPVTPEVYDDILLEFSKDKLQIERHRKEQARKVVVSKIQQKKSEEDGTSSEKEPLKKAVRKLKTSLKDETIALSSKLKDASDKLDQKRLKVEKVDDKTELEIKNIDTGEVEVLVCDYLVGCDGANSMVRKKLGFSYQGRSSSGNKFYDGKMLSIYINALFDHPRSSDEEVTLA